MYYYGVYKSPYCHGDRAYVGSPKLSEEECYSACGTDEDCLGVYPSESEADEAAKDYNLRWEP